MAERNSETGITSKAFYTDEEVYRLIKVGGEAGVKVKADIVSGSTYKAPEGNLVVLPDNIWGVSITASSKDELDRFWDIYRERYPETEDQEKTPV